MQIKFLDLKAINTRRRDEMLEAMSRVLDSGWYIRGTSVKNFELEYAKYVQAKYCVGVANGLDALRLILQGWMELGIVQKGQSVLVPANTYIATILAIHACGLNPVPVEPDPGTFNVTSDAYRKALNNNTRIILPVHLYGRAADVHAIRELAVENDLLVLEDAAQAHGAVLGDTPIGSIGDATAFSFYPGKNLGALGDAGCITTNNEELARVVRALGNYGSETKYYNTYRGCNSRLDELQAAILLIRLKDLEGDNDHRRHIAGIYKQRIKCGGIVLPSVPENPKEHVWHLYVIRVQQREKLQTALKSRGIETMVHYPVPPHKQVAFRSLSDLILPITESIHNEVLSLPISPVLTDEEAAYVADTLNEVL